MRRVQSRRRQRRPLRAAAGKAGRAEYLSLWAGQGLGLARAEGAADLMARLVAEAEAAIAGLPR